MVTRIFMTSLLVVEFAVIRRTVGPG